MLSVPRVLNRICDGIKKQFEEKCTPTKWLIEKALSTKMENLWNYGSLTHWFYDKLVFNKVKEALGGQVRLIAVGSAPIS